jgi:hypothetical protein
MFDTETNDHGGDAAVDIFGALWLSDSFAGFLTAGGKATFYYHALPYSPPHPACKNSWGTYRMFMTDCTYQIKQRTSQFTPRRSPMLINKDRESPRPVRIVFHDAEAKTDRHSEGAISIVAFGSSQYQWHSAGREVMPIQTTLR